MIEIRLKLKSFDTRYRVHAFRYITYIVRFFNLLIHKQVTFPTHINKFTVLRSPHIHKKSREQFQRKRSQQLLFLYVPNIQFAMILITLFKNMEIPGVELEVHLKFSDYFLVSN